MNSIKHLKLDLDFLDDNTYETGGVIKKQSKIDLPSKGYHLKGIIQSIFGIVFVVFILWTFFSSNDSSTSNSSSQYKANNNSVNIAAKNEIEGLKSALDDQETVLMSLKNEIEGTNTNAFTSQYEIDQYNMKIDEYSSKATKFRQDIARYNELVRQYNYSIQR